MAAPSMQAAVCNGARMTGTLKPLKEDIRKNLASSKGQQPGRQEPLYEVKAPGAHALCLHPHMHLIHMSDMSLSVTVKTVPGPGVYQDRTSLHMPGMTHDSFFMRLQPCWLQTVQQVCDLPRAVCPP